MKVEDVNDANSLIDLYCEYDNLITCEWAGAIMDALHDIEKEKEDEDNEG